MPTVASVNEVAGMVSTPKTVRLNACCVESEPPGAPDESVTLRVKVEVPPVLGVP
jgi:hypothetical protein